MWTDVDAVKIEGALKNMNTTNDAHSGEQKTGGASKNIGMPRINQASKTNSPTPGIPVGVVVSTSPVGDVSDRPVIHGSDEPVSLLTLFQEMGDRELDSTDLALLKERFSAELDFLVPDDQLVDCVISDGIAFCTVLSASKTYSGGECAYLRLTVVWFEKDAPTYAEVVKLTVNGPSYDKAMAMAKEPMERFVIPMARWMEQHQRDLRELAKSHPPATTREASHSSVEPPAQDQPEAAPCAPLGSVSEEYIDYMLSALTADTAARLADLSIASGAELTRAVRMGFRPQYTRDTPHDTPESEVLVILTTGGNRELVSQLEAVVAKFATEEFHSADGEGAKVSDNR